MNFISIHKSILALAILGVVSCKPNIDVTGPKKGSADFNRYIAIGNSLTAGYADGGLYLDGQKNSYPEMIAAQIKMVGGGSFATPFFPAAQSNGSGYLKLTGLTDGVPTIVPETSNLAIRGQVDGSNLYTRFAGDIENFGVPGIKLIHANVVGYGRLNSYFERLLTDVTVNTRTYLDFATAKPWTFFSLWLGNNDILGYASAGAAADAPTPKATFSSAYQAVVTKLVSTGAKGVVATIPDVTNTAYFRTVTLKSLLTAVNATQAGALIKEIYIQPGSGPVRSATAEDLFTLPLSAANLIGSAPNGIPYGLHPANPVESRFVLDKNEVTTVNDYIQSYNTTIKIIAEANNLAIMDAYSLLNEYASGKSANGIPISAAFIQGNLFSLDGIHLSQLGYAITANGFIEAINAKYGSTIPIVDVSKYHGVKLP